MLSLIQFLIYVESMMWRFGGYVWPMFDKSLVWIKPIKGLCWGHIKPILALYYSLVGAIFGLCWIYVESEIWIQTFLRKAHPSQSFLDLIESENSQDCGSSLHPSWTIFGGPVWFEPIWIDFGSIDLDTNHSRLSFQCISFKLFNLYIVDTRSYAFINDIYSIKKPVNTGTGLSNRIRGFEQGKLNGLKSERSVESGRFGVK